MDVGEIMAARIGGIIWRLFKKTFVWQFLDGKYDSGIA